MWTIWISNENSGSTSPTTWRALYRVPFNRDDTNTYIERMRYSFDISSGVTTGPFVLQARNVFVKRNIVVSESDLSLFRSPVAG
jgi:hypothetical protein